MEVCWAWHGLADSRYGGGVVSAPKVGDAITVRGVECRVSKVLPFGTIDVVSLCGRYAWRVSGFTLA